MITYARALDSAGIHDSRLRHGYRGIARVVLRAETAHYVAARLLMPPARQPHAVAAYWFVHVTDSLSDSGDAGLRGTRYAAWDRQVRQALVKGASPDAGLDAFCFTAAACGLPADWITRVLDALGNDVAFAGFETEDDYQDYVDRVALPSLLLFVGIHPELRGDQPVRACRALADACQRVDFLADLAADLREGRLCLPRAELHRLNVDPQALVAGQAAAGLAPLVSGWAALARESLAAARSILLVVPPELRPAMWAFLRLHELKLGQAEAAGERLPARCVTLPSGQALRVVLEARRMLRHSQLPEGHTERLPRGRRLNS